MNKNEAKGVEYETDCTYCKHYTGCSVSRGRRLLWGKKERPTTGWNHILCCHRGDKGNRLLVQGLEINDINGRGTFELAVGDKTELIWRGVPITLKDLRAGNTVSVTYTGEVLEISPAQVSDVLRIQLLDHETPY